MATAYTSLLGLALPVTGELQGTWGTTVNDAITSLLDTAVAGATTLNTDTDVTLTTTTGAANQARQAIILWTANGSVTRNITAPAQSKIYVVINATAGTQSIVIRGAGPTSGVTLLAGERAIVAWNGSDFVKVSTFGGSSSFTNVTVTGTTTLSGLTASTALALNGSKEVVSVTNTGTGNNVLSASPTLTGTVAGASLQLSSLTSGRVTYAGASGLLQDSANLTFNGTDLTVSGAVNAGSVNATTLDLTNLEVTNIKAKDGTASMTLADATGVATFSANPILNAGTANGVLYLNGSKVATSGTALVFDGSNLGIGVTPSAWFTSGRAIQLLNNGILSVNPTEINILSNAFLNANASSWIYQSSNAASRYNQAAGIHAWYTAPSGTAGNTITFTQAMTLDASNNLLIGTTSAVSGSKLVVDTGDATIYGVRVGRGAGAVNTNTAVGASALNANTTGTGNTALGSQAGANLTTGSDNVCIGNQAGTGSSTTSQAISIGFVASATGSQGIAIGREARTGTGSNNIAIGAYSGSSGSFTGQRNVLIGGHGGSAGANVGGAITSGSDNTIVGAVGGSSLTTGSTNTFVGPIYTGNAFTTGSRNTVIGGYNGNADSLDLRTANNNIVLSDGAGNARQYYDGASNFWAWRNGGSERMRLDSSGRLGIGSTSPATQLDVRGAPGADYGNATIFSTASVAAGVGGVLTFSGYKSAVNAVGIFAKIKGIKENATDNNEAGALTFETNTGSAYVERMRLDSSGNLGLGTNAPASLGANITTLDVRGATGGGIRFGVTGAQNGALYGRSTEVQLAAISNVPLLFLTNNTERMRIDTSGNVGIGTAPSAWGGTVKVLEIGSRNSSLMADTGASATLLLSNAYFNGTNWVRSLATGAAYYLVNGQTSGSHAWFIAGSGSAGSTISWTQAMTLDASGNLGIGTTSPSYRIQTNSTSGANVIGVTTTNTGAGDTAKVTCINGTVTLNLEAYAFSGVAALAVASNHPLAFYTNNTERMRLDSSGNLGIGTTSPVGRLRLAGSNATAFPNQGGCLWLTDTNAVANEGNWGIASSLAAFRILTGNFTFSGGYSAYTIENSGTTNEAANHIWYTGASQERMRLTGTGLGLGRTPTYQLDVNSTARFNSTVGVGNAAPSGSGAGITFPATQSASSDANTLDDYEEGTWTPSLGGTATYTARTGNYIKVGNLVRCFFDITVNAIGTGDINTISGFPFTAAFLEGGSISYFTGAATSVYWLTVQMNNATTNCDITGATTLGASINTAITVFQDGTRVSGTVVYSV